MKKLLILVIIPLLIGSLYISSDTLWNGDDDYARLGKVVTFTALTDTGYTEILELRSQVWSMISFFVFFTDIDDTCDVYYEGSPDNSKWFALDTSAPSVYTSADSANAVATTTYYKIFEQANLMNYFRIRIVPDSTINVTGYMTIGSN